MTATDLARRVHTIELAAGNARQQWGDRPTWLNDADVRRLRAALEIVAAELAGIGEAKAAALMLGWATE